MKIVYIILGAITLILGLIGVFVPGLPTTPFVLVTIFFWSRGSQRLNDWLCSTNFYKNRIEQFVVEKSIRKNDRVGITLLTVLMLSISNLLILNLWFLVFSLLIFALQQWYFKYKLITVN